MAKTIFPPSLVYEDGKQPTEVRLCPLNRTQGTPIYCSRDGRFFSYCLRRNPQNGPRERQLRPIKPCHFPPGAYDRYRSGGRKNYLTIRQAGNESCHVLVALTWIGPQRRDRNGHVYEVHHLNGNPKDNRAQNLIWLSRAEHRRFDAALKKGLILVLRDPSEIMEYEMTHHMEF